MFFVGVGLGLILLTPAKAEAQADGWYMSFGVGSGMAAMNIELGTGVSLLRSRIALGGSARLLGGTGVCPSGGTASCTYGGGVLQVAATLSPIAVGLIRPYGTILRGVYSRDPPRWEQDGWGYELGAGFEFDAPISFQVGFSRFSTQGSPEVTIEGLAVRGRLLVFEFPRQ